jgi:hypothetical protein
LKLKNPVDIGGKISWRKYKLLLKLS